MRRLRKFRAKDLNGFLSIDAAVFNFFGFSLIDAKLRFKKELVGGVIGAIAR